VTATATPRTATSRGDRVRRALRTEARKLLTLRGTAGFGGLAVAFVLMNTVALLALQGVEDPPVDLRVPDDLRTLLATGGEASLFALVMGILSATAEHRHGTIVPTLLAEPRRALVIGARAAATAVAGAVYGLAAAVACLAVALPWLAAVGHAPFGATDVARAAVGTVVGVALVAALGAALGALVRSQVVALVVGLVWLVLAEGLVLALAPEVGRWLPTGALAALTGGAPDVLAPWAGGLLLAGYALALTVVAAAPDGRRDVG